MPSASRAVMVCLISRQTMQNVLPILHMQPQRVVCLSTREEDSSRTYLEAVLQGQHIALDAPLYVDAYTPADTVRACQQLLARYGAEQLVANLTGGTKVMSLAAFRTFAAAGVPCLYTDTPHQRLLYLYPETQAAEPLVTRVDVLTYLQAHGQRASLRDQALRLRCPAMTAFIGQHIADLEPFLGRLRYEMQRQGQTRLLFTPEGKQRRHIAAQFLSQAMQQGLLEAKPAGRMQVEITFRDEKARRYLEGEWLEDLVYSTVQQVGCDSAATNVALAWKDAPDREMNEIDVAVVHNLRFYYLSCKTGSEASQMKQHLFELETLSALAGGLFNHPILVASSPKAAPAYLRRRMETLGITYIGPADLPRLGARLKEIIR